MATAAISLNEIISILSDRVGKPFNVPLQEELKRIVRYKRVTFMQRSLEKHPDQYRLFQQSFTAELELVSEYDQLCSTVEVNLQSPCKVLVTTCQIPQPMRLSGRLFDFVGSSNFKKAYGNSSPELIQYIQANKYTGNNPKWFFVNKKVYILNNSTLRYIGLRGVFEHPEDINTCACETVDCYNDDSPFPAPQDLINDIVRDTLSVELRNIFPSFGEVEVDKTQPQQTGT